ncbi:MAG: hypothetical protein N2C14_00625, partial [Planctomycetales bacterium]
MPDYLSASDYVRKARQSPLRRAILATVENTHKMEFNGTPRLTFAAKPGAYQGTIDKAREPILEELKKFPAAMIHLGPQGMEQQYEQEESPRWRAWYDLTRGRMLALYVRNREYNAACEEMKGRHPDFLNNKFNRWWFKPSEEIRSGDLVEKAAAEAVRLLERCRERNPGTPWAILAERELRHGFGFEVETAYVPPPKPRPPKVVRKDKGSGAGGDGNGKSKTKTRVRPKPVEPPPPPPKPIVLPKL